MNCSIPRVTHWRHKWLENQDVLNQIEEDPEKNKQLEKSIRQVLKDKPRSGIPATYSSEEYCRILAVALEPPEESGRPISQWSSQDLADECKKRGPPLEFRPSNRPFFKKNQISNLIIAGIGSIPITP